MRDERAPRLGQQTARVANTVGPVARISGGAADSLLRIHRALFVLSGFTEADVPSLLGQDLSRLRFPYPSLRSPLCIIASADEAGGGEGGVEGTEQAPRRMTGVEAALEAAGAAPRRMSGLASSGGAAAGGSQESDFGGGEDVHLVASLDVWRRAGRGEEDAGGGGSQAMSEGGLSLPSLSNWRFAPSQRGGLGGGGWRAGPGADSASPMEGGESQGLGASQPMVTETQAMVLGSVGESQPMADADAGAASQPMPDAEPPVPPPTAAATAGHRAPPPPLQIPPSSPAGPSLAAPSAGSAAASAPQQHQPPPGPWVGGLPAAQAIAPAEASALSALWLAFEQALSLQARVSRRALLRFKAAGAPATRAGSLPL